MCKALQCTLFFSTSGKHERPSAVGAIADNIKFQRRLYVTDLSDIRFLVDTGVHISLLPKAIERTTCKPTSFLFYAANNVSISTFGEKTLFLKLRLWQQFCWTVLLKLQRPFLELIFYTLLTWLLI